MKNECVAVVGWILGIEGALGLIGIKWLDGDLGLIHLLFTPDTWVYVVLVVIGVGVAVGHEAARKRGRVRG
ncbi:hypothetical protein [Streptomyces sp. NPDC051561]|uniref:hypothetical protein n=1 Tax=Streptomyces sp. NPDC051561 TaxID=3365658 RepID=UPI0037A5CAC9